VKVYPCCGGIGVVLCIKNTKTAIIIDMKHDIADAGLFVNPSEKEIRVKENKATGEIRRHGRQKD